MRRRLASLPPTALRIGDRLSIKGEIVGEGDFELAGRFEGLIDVEGIVVVGDQAEADANITASTVVVGGTVRGNLTAAGRVAITASGAVTGNVRAGSLIVADGAEFRGHMMIGLAETIPRGRRVVLHES